MRKGHFVFRCLLLTGIEWRKKNQSKKKPTNQPMPKKHKKQHNPSSDEKDKFSKTVTDSPSRYRRRNATKIRLAWWISAANSISKPKHPSLSLSHTPLPISAELSQPSAPLPMAPTGRLLRVWRWLINTFHWRWWSRCWQRHQPSLLGH